MKLFRKLAFLFGVLFLASCQEVKKDSKSKLEFEDDKPDQQQGPNDETGSDGGETGDLPDEDPVPVKVSFDEVLNKVIKTNSCTNCHAWVSVEKEFLKRVVPGEPFDSRVFKLMRNGSMPPRGNPVSTKDLELVEDYINGLE